MGIYLILQVQLKMLLLEMPFVKFWKVAKRLLLIEKNDMILSGII